MRVFSKTVIVLTAEEVREAVVRHIKSTPHDDKRFNSSMVNFAIKQSNDSDQNYYLDHAVLEIETQDESSKPGVVRHPAKNKDR